MDIHQVTAARNQKRIRIEGSSSQNKRITFNDDGEKHEDDTIRRIAKATINGDSNISTGEIAKANEDYLRRVKERLSATKDIDRFEE